MGHGQRDWANVGTEEVVHGLSDLAELGARLWSPNLFNREGVTVFQESFQHGLAFWRLVDTGSGVAELSPAIYRTGGYSVRLYAGETSANAAYLYGSLPYPVLGNYGAEVSFTLDSKVDKVNVALVLHDGSESHSPQLLVDVPGRELQYLDEDSAWQTAIAGLQFNTDDYLFHTLKLVVDWVDKEYLRVFFDNRFASLAGIPYPRSTSSTSPYIQFQIRPYGVSGQLGQAYVDDIIITQAELAT